MDKTTFDQKEFDLAYPLGIENHYWTLARNHIIERQLKATNIAKPNILEIGCGRGIVVNYFRRRGYNCWGVELAQQNPIDGVREYVFAGQDANKLPLKLRQSFNTIFLLDVIEHLPDPVTFLSEILDSFPSATHLIITAPARQELWSNYDEYYQHFRRYDLEMLQNTIEAINCKILDLRYFFHLLYVPARLTLSLFQKRPVQMKAPPNALKSIHYLLSKICILDYWLLPKRIRGASIISTVCREY